MCAPAARWADDAAFPPSFAAAPRSSRSGESRRRKVAHIDDWSGSSDQSSAQTRYKAFVRAEPDLAAGVASIDPRPSGLAAPGARAAPVLERTVQLALAATVFAFAAGSTYVVPVLAVGRPLRWLFLAGLAVLALAYAVARGRARVSWAPGVLALLLPGLALVSLAWSVDGPATVRRGGAFLVLFGAAAALAHGTAGRKGAVEGMLVALVTGAAAVA